MTHYGPNGDPWPFTGYNPGGYDPGPSRRGFHPLAVLVVLAGSVISGGLIFGAALYYYPQQTQDFAFWAAGFRVGPVPVVSIAAAVALLWLLYKAARGPES